jgi:hypothetical protein
VKLLVSNAAGIIVASATSIGEKARTKGSIGRGGGGAELIINARAHVEPQVLKSIVESSISAVAGNAIGLSEVHLTSFKPAYPRPTHRFGKVVIPA